MILYDGYDISAGGPGTFEIFEEDECAKKCIDTIGCRGFTMVPNEPYKGCHLKENFGFRNVQKHSRTDLVSGVLCGGSRDKNGKIKRSKGKKLISDYKLIHFIDRCRKIEGQGCDGAVRQGHWEHVFLKKLAGQTEESCTDACLIDEDCNDFILMANGDCYLLRIGQK